MTGRVVVDEKNAKSLREQAGLEEPAVTPEELANARMRHPGVRFSIGGIKKEEFDAVQTKVYQLVNAYKELGETPPKVMTVRGFEDVYAVELNNFGGNEYGFQIVASLPNVEISDTILKELYGAEYVEGELKSIESGSDVLENLRSVEGRGFRLSGISEHGREALDIPGLDGRTDERRTLAEEGVRGSGSGYGGEALRKLPVTAAADELIAAAPGAQATRIDDSEVLSNGKTYTESLGTDKIYETRPKRNSIPLNRWVPIQSTHSVDPERQNKIVGFAWFDSVKEYTKEDFHSPENQVEHLVPFNSKFDALDRKYGFHVARYVPIEPRTPSVPARGATSTASRRRPPRPS